MKVLLTGATGSAGLPMLRMLLADPTVDAVTVAARRPLPDWVNLPPSGATTHPKLTVIPDFNFLKYSPEAQATVAAHDACIWALGKSQVGFNEEQYTEFTYTYVVKLLDALKTQGAGTPEHPYRVVFVSGQGADSTEKSSVLFGRVKGRTENAILSAAHASNGTIKATILRPAYFHPESGDASHQRSTLLRAADLTLGKVLKAVMPSTAISVKNLAQFAIGAAKGKWEEQGELFENTEMLRLVREAGRVGKDEL
ncbi:hypothetical protein FA95DRAFT_1527715 [Auriscalpium vulgare]|uniref:Uncharacterized protein n=1 Tax=Auriscalpium vulgare TaxID=40419 RepID=A0ACB8R9V8_9AGAM|nr:hypothetical protein FA95DRAFT_1527715 [Auriscalpium vulgare]